MEWLPIESAPQDGTVLRLKRIYQGSVIAEGKGRFATLHELAPSRSPLGPDLLGRLTAADYARETQATQEWAATAKWLTEDRMYAFPTPTHWLPMPTPPVTASPDRS